MTRALAAACEVVGVPLLDHVIVARGGASSLRRKRSAPVNGRKWPRRVSRSLEARGASWLSWVAG